MDTQQHAPLPPCTCSRSLRESAPGVHSGDCPALNESWKRGLAEEQAAKAILRFLSERPWKTANQVRDALYAAKIPMVDNAVIVSAMDALEDADLIRQKRDRDGRRMGRFCVPPSVRDAMKKAEG
jgi:hypothetical protein